MRLNSFRSGFLELLSSCVVHILYFDDFDSTPHSLTPSQSIQKSSNWTRNAAIGTLFPKPTPLSPTVSVVFLQNQQEMSQTRDECPQRNWTSIRHI